MTTINRLASLDITIDFELPVECMNWDDLAAMTDEALDDLWRVLKKEEEADWYGLSAMDAARKDLFHMIEGWYDHKYYEENIGKFREFESHKNEPDFDWDFYSDWHKDLFGYRPR